MPLSIIINTTSVISSASFIAASYNIGLMINNSFSFLKVFYLISSHLHNISPINQINNITISKKA